MTNPIAQELNAVIHKGAPRLLQMLSKVGRRLYFPKGILSQSAEAKAKADDKFNATIGIATENLHTMHLPSVMKYVQELTPGEALRYAPSFGDPALRHAWKEALYEKNPSLSGKNVSLPVVTNGITHGLSVFADMFIDPDDVLIFPDKMWGNNQLIMTVRRDGRIIQYPLFSDAGGFNLDAFEQTVYQQAEQNHKIIVFLNFPNNPTGYTVTEAEGDRIINILTAAAEKGTNVIAAADDAYFGLRFEDAPIKESLFARLCGRHPGLLAVKLDGATKEMFVWGLRVGFITYGAVIDGDPAAVYDALEKKTAGDVRGAISNASRLSQSIVLKVLQSPDYQKEREAKVAVMKGRALKVKEASRNPKYQDAWDVYPFNSGYFMCLKLKTAAAEPLRLHLLEKYRVGLISIGKTDLRIAFSSVDEANVEPLFELIHQGVKDLERNKAP